jgi:GT2 family glycosyltransferase
MTRLGIIVVSYGSADLLRENLAAIDRSKLPDAVVVVVDNRTTATERRTVTSLSDAHGWLLETPPNNLGFGAGMNLGARRALAAGCDRLLLLNPDVSIDADDIRALVSASEARPLTAVSPRLDRPDGTVWFAGGQLDRQTGLTRSRPDHEQRGPDRWLTAACLLVDRELWERLGGFDERYFLYWEDVDLSQRILAEGGDLLVLHDITVVHQVGATQGTVGKSATYMRFMCRNRLLFAATHTTGRERRRWLWHAPRHARIVVTRDGRRMALRHPTRSLAALRGTLEGVRLLLTVRPSA